MDHSFRRTESDPSQQPSDFLAAKLQIVSGTITWLVSLVQLTEKEREDAGVCYPYRERSE